MYRASIVTFVSAGMLSPKKRDHALARRQLYLNYGALSLATTLELAGYDVALLHGEHRAPKDVLKQLEQAGQFPSIYPLMVSIPSFYALPWAQAFCKLAKASDPHCRDRGRRPLGRRPRPELVEMPVAGSRCTSPGPQRKRH